MNTFRPATFFLYNITMIGKLFIVATPIGNLADISARAIETLKSVDIILAEDTRVTGKLLRKYDIGTKRVSYRQQSFKNPKKLNQILAYLLEGKNLALVSDAGTPGINDPGNELIDFLYASGPFTSEFLEGPEGAARIPTSNEPSARNSSIIPIPGPSAITAALSVCGFKASPFLFNGFVPKKKKTKWLQSLSQSHATIVYFDSPHRLVKNLQWLEENLGERHIFIGRELTKLHEETYRGDISEVMEKLNKSNPKGEVVVVIAPI